MEDKFIKLLMQKALEFPLAVGVRTKIFNNAYSILLDAQDKGVRFIFGKPEPKSEISLAPVLVTGVTKDMKIWDEETFRSSASIFVERSDAEAIDLVNAPNYGLDAFHILET